LARIKAGNLTNMDLGIVRATEVLKNQGRKGAVQVIILLSDGAPNNPEAALEAARIAREGGIRLMTVGIGEANEALLRQIAGDTGAYRFASDDRGLEEAFLAFGRYLVKPPAARQITYIHRYDADSFELLPGSEIPQPIQREPGMLAWQIDELDEMPRYFRYLVRPLQSGDSMFIDLPGEVSYQRCGVGLQVTMGVSPAAKVRVREYGHVPPPIQRRIPDRFKVVRPEVVWQPDHALFIGIGGSGRWILTHIRKNLLDSGAGYLSDGVRFLLLDTDEYEKINGQQVAVSVAGVEIPSESVFVLDENLLERVKEWTTRAAPEHQGWFEAGQYQGMNQQLNLADGTHGMRQLPRVALLRSLQGAKNLNSQWAKHQEMNNRNTDLPAWLRERCKDVYRKDRDEVRIFIVGSLAGGMSGIILDIANLARQVAENVVTLSGIVNIEGYFIDAVPFESLPGSQNAGDQRQANAYIALREIARWQLNPGYSLATGWDENLRIARAPFDDILIFSGQVGSGSMLAEKDYPGIADVITTRLDKATGAGSSADWFSQMRKARSDRQRTEHELMIGSAGAYTLRLPVADILKALHARWAYNLLHIFLSGNKDKEIRFDYHAANDPGFSAEPGQYVPVFLSGSMGGDAPLESQTIADLLLFDRSDLIGSDESRLVFEKSDEDIAKSVKGRLANAILHILFGTVAEGNRAGRLAYASEFLQEMANQLSAMRGRLNGELQRPDLARVASIYASVAETLRSQLEALKIALIQSRPDTPYGLVDKLQKIDSDLSNIREELAKISCRQYFWGKVGMDSSGNKIEEAFIDSWWAEFLADKEEYYVDSLGWVATEYGIDLEVRLDSRPVYLLKDGVSAVVEGMNRMAASLTAPVWEGSNLSLAEVAASYNYFASEQEGKVARQRSMDIGVLNVSADPGVPMGRVLYVAPGSMQRIGANKPFQRGLEQALPEETNAIAVETKILNGTDRMSATVLRLQDAVNIKRLSSYQRAENANDRLDGWNSVIQRYEGAGDLPRVTQRAEGEARRLERMDIFRGYGKLHPLVVAALENPRRAELFCLALANGLIQMVQDRSDDTPYFFMKLTGISEPLPLLYQVRQQITPFVDALLYWSLESQPDPWELALSQIFSKIDELDRSRLNRWLEGPPQEFVKGPPDHQSLGQLTSALVRNLMKTKSRRWNS
jgi:hypothetical protein